MASYDHAALGGQTAWCVLGHWALDWRWQIGEMTCVLNIGRQGAREATLLALIGAPEVMEYYMMHARSRCDACDARKRCVAAVMQARRRNGAGR